MHETSQSEFSICLFYFVWILSLSLAIILILSRHTHTHSCELFQILIVFFFCSACRFVCMLLFLISHALAHTYTHRHTSADTHQIYPSSSLFFFLSIVFNINSIIQTFNVESKLNLSMMILNVFFSIIQFSFFFCLLYDDDQRHL